MRIFFSFLSLLIVSAAVSQTAVVAEDHLLWYKGKKIGNNVLLTSNGDTVFYQPSKGILRVSIKKGNDKFASIKTELDKTDQRIKQSLSKITAALPKQLSPYLANPLKETYKKIQDEYKEILSNTIQLPDWNLIEKEMVQVTSHGPSMGYKEYIDIEKLLMQFIDKIKAYGEKISAEKLTDVPQPPRRDLGYCFECDTEKLKEKKEYDDFIEKLWGEDEDMHRLILGAYRQVQLMGDWDLDKRLRASVEPVEQLIINRKKQKLLMLVEKYIDDPYYNFYVLQLVLGHERQRQLMGEVKEGDDLFHPALERVFDAFEKFYLKARAEYNYEQMLDIRSMLIIERMQQLMGGKRYFSYIDSYLSFNHFKMSINVSEKMGSDGVYVISQIRGDNYFAAVPDTNCKLKWILIGPDKDKMKFKLEAVDYVAPVKPEYVGTRDWYSDKPIMNIDFCNEEDTVEPAQFYPVGLKEKWVYPQPLGLQYFPVISSAITSCFLNKERLYEKAAYWNNSEHVAALKAKMTAEHEKFMKNSKNIIGKDPSKMTAAEMMKMASALTATDTMHDLIQAPSVINFFVKTKAENKNRIVFKEQLDGRQLFPDNPAIQYAWFNIQLEQDPDSPYRLDLMNMSGKAK